MIEMKKNRTHQRAKQEKAEKTMRLLSIENDSPHWNRDKEPGALKLDIALGITMISDSPSTSRLPGQRRSRRRAGTAAG